MINQFLSQLIKINVGIDFFKDFLFILLTVYGFSTWQREYRGKRKSDLIEEALVLFYEAKDAIVWMRSPFGYADEDGGLIRRDGESEADYQARKRYNFVFVRYKEFSELFSKINASRYRFMAIFGKSAEKQFVEFNSLVRSIVYAARKLIILEPIREFSDEAKRKKHGEKLSELRSIIWDEEEKDDPIYAQMNGIISGIENFAKNQKF